jgi:hypothetical protein
MECGGNKYLKHVGEKEQGEVLPSTAELIAEFVDVTSLDKCAVRCNNVSLKI